MLGYEKTLFFLLYFFSSICCVFLINFIARTYRTVSLMFYLFPFLVLSFTDCWKKLYIETIIKIIYKNSIKSYSKTKVNYTCFYFINNVLQLLHSSSFYISSLVLVFNLPLSLVQNIFLQSVHVYFKSSRPFTGGLMSWKLFMKLSAIIASDTMFNAKSKYVHKRLSFSIVKHGC